MTSDNPWYIDGRGRITSVKSFSYGDFAETPLFVRTALEHNQKLALGQDYVDYLAERLRFTYGHLVVDPNPKIIYPGSIS